MKRRILCCVLAKGALLLALLTGLAACTAPLLEARATQPVGTPLTPTTPSVSIPASPTAQGPPLSIYRDPAGGFRLALPAGWRATGEGTWAGEGGFAQVAYQPQWGFVASVAMACQWLANVTYPGEYTLAVHPHHCVLTPRPQAQAAAPMALWENPQADPAHRFVLLRADAAHFAALAASFAWVQPPAPHARFAPWRFPPRPEDRAFWRQTQPLPAQIRLVEVPLPAAFQGADPADRLFPWPQETLADLAPSRPAALGQASPQVETLNAQLQPYGYRLAPGERSDLNLWDLYLEGRPLVRHLYGLPRVDWLDTPQGPQPALLTLVMDNPDEVPSEEAQVRLVLVVEGALYPWRKGMPRYWPRVTWTASGVRVLDLGPDATLQVLDLQQRPAYAFTTFWGANLPPHRFGSWQGQWWLAVDEFLVQQGEVLNARWGMEGLFGWHLVAGEPFFFFRRGPWVGLAYAGHYFAPRYERVAHGLCCGYAANNPRFGARAVAFFGQRQGRWYAVRFEVLP